MAVDYQRSALDSARDVLLRVSARRSDIAGLDPWVLCDSRRYRDDRAFFPSEEGLAHPPDIAPMMKKGSLPVATASGSGASGGSCEMSRSHAKKRTYARRLCVM